MTSPSKHHRTQAQAATDKLAGYVLILCAAAAVAAGIK